MSHRFTRRLATISVLALALTTAPQRSLAGDSPPPVSVVVDMDAATPGVQHTVTITACTDHLAEIAVYVSDPTETRSVWSIGYIGGIDRGIAFGHVPDVANAGVVTAVTAAPVAPVNPDNDAYVWTEGAIQPAFSGSEVQYIEAGAATPATIGATPMPIMHVSVALENAGPGDVFAFYLADEVTIWSGGVGGAFSTTAAINALDTGGDSIPDATDTVAGMDADAAIAVPPAAYHVDFVDGPAGGGPATIVVVARPGDLDGDGDVGVVDLLQLLRDWGPCPGCASDGDGDGVVTVVDMLALLAAWGERCAG